MKFNTLKKTHTSPCSIIYCRLEEDVGTLEVRGLGMATEDIIGSAVATTEEVDISRLLAGEELIGGKELRELIEPRLKLRLGS